MFLLKIPLRRESIYQVLQINVLVEGYAAFDHAIATCFHKIRSRDIHLCWHVILKPNMSCEHNVLPHAREL